MNNNWQSKKLVELCKTFNDGDWIEKKDQSLNGIRLIQTGNIGTGIFKDREEKARYISEETYKRLRCTEVLPGDCLISRLPDPIGRACIIPNTGKKMIAAVDCSIIRFDTSKILPIYFNCYSQGIQYLKAVNKEATGTTRKRISRKNLGLIQITYPVSIDEQNKIIKRLTEVLNDITNAKKNTEQNLLNAHEFFESSLQNIFNELNKSSEHVKLSELATDITDGDHLPPPKSATGIPFITISNINKQNNTIDFTNTYTVSHEYYQKLKANRKPKKGDVLFTVTGSYGIPVIVESDLEFCFQRHIGLIRPKPQIMNRWLYYWILSPQCIKQAKDTATGTAQKTVSLKALRNFLIPKITLSEQKAIVNKIDVISEQTNKLELTYRQKLNFLEELKNSVLQKAFSGGI